MKKYKFILTIADSNDNEFEIDSAEEIEGHEVWPSWSHAEPHIYRGIFDSYNEAKEYAEKFKIYKYIYTDGGWDSFEEEDDPGCGYGYYLSEEDACEAANQCSYESDDETRALELDDIDEIKVEKITDKEDIPEDSYKFKIIFRGEVAFDSMEDCDCLYFDSEDDALEAAKETLEDGDVIIYECDYAPYVIMEVNIVKREVVEFESN